MDFGTNLSRSIDSSKMQRTDNSSPLVPGSTNGSRPSRSRPVVSIVTACFNSEKTIADTLESVRRQSYPAIEHLVIDGASRDGTMSIVQEHHWPGLRAVSEPDKGTYDAMNKGLSAASGDIVAFLNADDFLAHPDAIEHIVREFEAHPGTQCVFGNVVLVDPVDVQRLRRSYRAPQHPKRWFRFGHMPPHPAAFVRRDLLVASGGFKLSYKIVADFDLLLRLLCVQGVSHRVLDEAVTVMRLGGLSTEGLSATVRINREMADSCRRNGIVSHSMLIWLKYLLKWVQLIDRPTQTWRLPRAWAKPTAAE